MLFISRQEYLFKLTCIEGASRKLMGYIKKASSV